MTTVGQLDESKIPAWVPRYPDVAGQMAGFHQATGSGSEGVLMFTTGDDAEKVADFYSDELTSFSGSSSGTITVGDTIKATRTFSDSGKRLELTATSGSGGPTQVQVTYSE